MAIDLIEKTRQPLGDVSHRLLVMDEHILVLEGFHEGLRLRVVIGIGPCAHRALDSELSQALSVDL